MREYAIVTLGLLILSFAIAACIISIAIIRRKLNGQETREHIITAMIMSIITGTSCALLGCLIWGSENATAFLWFALVWFVLAYIRGKQLQ